MCIVLAGTGGRLVRIRRPPFKQMIEIDMKHSDKYRNWFDSDKLVSDLMDQAADDIDERDAEIERLREALRKAGAAVERLAFKMPPPNVWTPQFVQLGQQIARSALPQKESE